MPKIKGTICNIPVSVDETFLTLPRPSGSSPSVILVKLKKKLSFSGHVYFEPVIPERIYSALSYLKSNNKFYEDITIDMNNVPSDFLQFANEDNEIEIDSTVSESDEECVQNCQKSRKFIALR